MAIVVPDGTMPGSPEASGFLGAGADVNPQTLEVGKRVIQDVDQAFSVAESMIWAWAKGIRNAARITAKLNGERPFGTRQLKNKAKAHKRNISTRFLQTQCARIHPRFYMPIKDASTLTAASLPDDWPLGAIKTEKFRKRITKTIRSWSKWDWFVRGLASEVTNFGFGFAVWFDEYEWRPNLIRMDKGFVPQGTEIMDHDMQFFVVKWQYHPNDLLKLLKDSVESGRDEWKKDACVEAINKAAPPPVGPTFDKWRDYEELIRQSVWSLAYYKSLRLIDTYHLFVREHTGKVSHYILWKDGVKAGGHGKTETDTRLIYENLDEHEAITEVCVPVVFGYGDGSIQGSWGAGQLLFDLANQVEIMRCDAVDAQLAQGKMKLQVAEGKNVNDVKLVINDDMMTVSGAQIAQPGAALPANAENFKALDDKFTEWAMTIVGNYIPPLPLQPSDIKAAQVNAAMSKEQETSLANLDAFLKPFAYIIRAITKRLTDPSTPDPVARDCRDKLLNEDKLTEEEIRMLADQPAVQTITEFTPSAAAARAQFAASRLQNPQVAQFYNPRKLEEIQAQAVPGGQSVISYAMMPEQDQTVAAEAIRQQTMENTTMESGKDVGVVSSDNDYVHMNTMKQDMELHVVRGNLPVAQTMLRHYGAHYTAGVAKKSIPPDRVNEEKSYIANVEKAMGKVAQMQQQAALQQQQQQPPQGGQPQAGGQPGQPQNLPPGQSQEGIRSSMSIQVKWTDLTPQERAVIMNKLGVPEIIPPQEIQHHLQAHLKPEDLNPPLPPKADPAPGGQ